MDINTELKTLLESVELSEDTALKLQLMVSEAIQNKLELVEQNHAKEIEFIKESAQEYGDTIREEFQAEIDELKEQAQNYGDYITEELSKKLESYADYVVEQFVKENNDKFVEGATFEKMSNAFAQIKAAFENNGFTLSEDTQNAIAPMEKKLQESVDSYNTLFQKYSELAKQLESLQEERETEKRTAIFESLVSNLADTQKERITKLLNTMTFKSSEDYSRAVEVLVNEVASASTKTESVKPAEPEKSSNQISNENRMKEYLKRL